MKRWICTLLSISLLFASLSPMDIILAEDTLSDTEASAVLLSGMEKAAGLDDTFPTIDGNTISLKADVAKEVTMLIFGRTTCGNSSSILQSIAESGWIHNPKVHVIFAEINKADEQSTRTFAKTYGCDEISFCYDPQGGTAALMWQYLIDAGMGGSVTLPAIILLDSQNTVRSILTGYQSSNDLFREMNQFAIISGSASDEEEDTERNLFISGQDDYEAAYQTLALVNQIRTQAGRPALKMDAELLETAMVRAMEISVFYSHMRPCGENCFSIFRSSSSYGENITLGKMTPEDAVEGWSNSPGHYANMIGEAYTSIGIGCFVDGNGTRYWTQCFDNQAAIAPTKQGTETVTRTIPILQSLLRLQTKESNEIGCGNNEAEIKMGISNQNAEWAYGNVPLSPANFTYSSNNPDIAAVDEKGTITIKAAGTAIITASLKENPAIQVHKSITKNGHSYRSSTTAPTYDSQGYTKHTCISCGYTYRDAYTPQLAPIKVSSKDIRLSKTSVTYNGKLQKPSIAATDSQGKKINSSYYTITYKNNKNVGQAAVTISFKNHYSGTVTKTFRILPKGTSLSKAIRKKKSLAIKWKKQTSQTTGYEIAYSTSSKFAKGATKTITVPENKKSSKTIPKLKAGKRYYVRIRTYKTVTAASAPLTLYSAWSKAKSASVKR